MPVLGTDPLGHRVVLDPLRWEAHVLARHPGMAGREADVRRAIVSPDTITETGSTRRGRWEPRLALCGPTTGGLLRVVVRPWNPTAAALVTAYVTKGPRPGAGASDAPTWRPCPPGATLEAA